MQDRITKVSRHITQNEGLIFEKSSPGKKAYRLPELDVPTIDVQAALGEHAREDLGNMPEVSEIEVIRHFTRLSTWNYAIDLGMYPLGSCTMKYNARINEHVARFDGIGTAHPYQPESLSQGVMQIMADVSKALVEITGMDTITLQPAAGAHGEMTGLLLIRAYHESNGNARKKILIPDSAHGTNPATAAICGYQVQNIKSDPHSGMVDVAELERVVDEDVAALMLTNPNTLGVFEQHIHRIADILHAKGAQLYMDGANMNALVGKARPGDFGVDVMHLNLHKTFSTPHGGGGPGSGPVACKAHLEPFLPTPVLSTKDGKLHFDYDRPHTVGRVRMWYGNFGMFVRALAYILANGPDGLRQTTEDAVLNANYVRAKLQDVFDLPYKAASMHEVVFSDRIQNAKGVRTGDIAKRLIDYGFHPYTTSFPLIVPGALMIEPTESESKEELDLFINAMRAIAAEVEEDPQFVLAAPHNTRAARMDEVGAARKPILRWKPNQK
ncbi:MAG: aminomethyl-transferring glycine dehydrogenase subunit GcvPB [Acidobacteriaceae bacterium]